MRKIIAVLLAFSLIFSATITVSADGVDITETTVQCFTPCQVLSSGGTGLITNIKTQYYSSLEDWQIKELETLLDNALKNMETDPIDVSAYNIKASIENFVENEDGNGLFDYNTYTNEYQYNEYGAGEYDVVTDCLLYNMLTQIVYNNPDYFHFYASGFDIPGIISANPSVYKSIVIDVDYLYLFYYSKNFSNIEEYHNALDFCEEELDKIIELIPTEFSDLEKVIFVHDYLISKGYYDLSDTWGSMYYFLKNNSGVCQSYAMTFKALMDRLSIENTTAVSDIGVHIWNMVKINGNYYHVDCTQDDSVVTGEFSRQFLLIDDSIKDEDDRTVDPNNYGHYSWYTVPSYGTQISCDSSIYNSASWKVGTGGGLFYYEGYWYNVSDTCPTTIYRYDGRTLNNKTSMKTSDKGKFLISNFSHRATIMLGNELFFTDLTSIYKYNIVSKAITPVYTTPTPDVNPDLFYGCYYSDNGHLGYYLSSNVLDNTRNINLNVNGDIDRNSSVDANDLSVAVNMILDRPHGSYNEFFADLDYNSRVDVLDLVLLKHKIAGID